MTGNIVWILGIGYVCAAVTIIECRIMPFIKSQK